MEYPPLPASVTPASVSSASGDLPLNQIEQEVQTFGRTFLRHAQRGMRLSDHLLALLFRSLQSKPKTQRSLFETVLFSAERPTASLRIPLQQQVLPAAAEEAKFFAFLLRLGSLPFFAPLTNRIARGAIQQMTKQYLVPAEPQRLLRSLQRLNDQGFELTVDLLGEYAQSEQDAELNLTKILALIRTLESLPLVGCNRHALSIKMSAICTNLKEVLSNERRQQLMKRLLVVVAAAQKANLQIYVDAEDTLSNDTIYSVFEELFLDHFPQYSQPGIVVQAYLSSAPEILERLVTLGKRRGRVAVRLVKGAYVDYETANAKERGIPNPLVTSKTKADLQFENLAVRVIQEFRYIYPTFGTHNARSISVVCKLMEHYAIAPHDFELQMLYGMAGTLARTARDAGYRVRLYVPSGDTQSGIGYLVRRLLENSSQEGFLNHAFVNLRSINTLLKRPV